MNTWNSVRKSFRLTNYNITTTHPENVESPVVYGQTSRIVFLDFLQHTEVGQGHANIGVHLPHRVNLDLHWPSKKLKYFKREHFRAGVIFVFFAKISPA